MLAPVRPNLTLSSSFPFDALIIGAGPAGLSAALALSRVKRPAVVFSTSNFRNDQAHRAHNILSRDHTPPEDIRQAGRDEIERYGTTRFVDRAIVKARNVDVDEGTRFEVEDQKGEKWQGKKVLLAMGAEDVMPDIEGYAEWWGYDIYQCLFCDGVERSDHPGGTLGFPSPMYLHYVNIQLHFGCPTVTIFGNGLLKPRDEGTANALKIAEAKGAKVDERRIRMLIHLGREEGIEVVFEDGSNTHVGFLAHRPDTKVMGLEIAKDLGVEILPDGMGGTMLKRNEPFGESNVHGIFVAGDVGVLMKTFAVAMCQGVAAGGGISFQLSSEDDERVAKVIKDVKKPRVTQPAEITVNGH